MKRETEKPQYEQDYSDSPKHSVYSTVRARFDQVLLHLTALPKAELSSDLIVQ
jgi:hypothetical protein